MEKKLQKMYLIYYNLLIAQYLWQSHYQILSIIFLNKFVELNVNSDTLIEKCEICGTIYKYCNCFLEYTNFKDNLIEYQFLLCNKNCQRKFNEKLMERLFNTNKLLLHKIIFYVSERML